MSHNNNEYIKQFKNCICLVLGFQNHFKPHFKSNHTYISHDSLLWNYEVETGKVSLCLIKYYAINADRQKEVQLHTFSILALAGLSGKIHSPADLAAGKKPRMLTD